MSTSGSDNCVLLAQLADEFAERYRRGERPSLTEYVERYPHLAADIRELFPAMVEIEQVKEDRQDAAGQVALKVLPRNRLLDSRAKQRFEREAKAAAKLHHTNIVPVFGVGEQDGLPYYVMQFIQGLGLNQVLEELKRLRLDGDFKPAVVNAGPPTGKELSAAEVARSLLSGRFEPAPVDSSPEQSAAQP